MVVNILRSLLTKQGTYLSFLLAAKPGDPPVFLDQSLDSNLPVKRHSVVAQVPPGPLLGGWSLQYSSAGSQLAI